MQQTEMDGLRWCTHAIYQRKDAKTFSSYSTIIITFLRSDLNPNAKDFVPLNLNAKEFVPLNPSAKEFTPWFGHNLRFCNSVIW